MTSIPAQLCRVYGKQFQTPLSQKQKIFSGFFIAFLKCAWSLEDFQKNNENASLIIPEIVYADIRGYWHV